MINAFLLKSIQPKYISNCILTNTEPPGYKDAVSGLSSGANVYCEPGSQVRQHGRVGHAL